jgi:2-(3-amino-3-carboxypropyl)histidine synthase
MKEKTFNEINDLYNLEIDRIIETIKRRKAKNVLLQFPDGMKPYSQIILSRIEEISKINCFISIDSCFGACDLPIYAENLGIDLIIQFGHSNWNYNKEEVLEL